MKIKLWISVAVLGTVLVAQGATNDLTGLLQRGLFEEEANRNLDAAAEAYQSLAGQFDKDRQVAATAIFRLGEVYRKQGKTNEAVVQYERVLKEFSDQQTLATLSRQNLAGLGAGGNASASGGVLANSIALAEAELASAQAQYDAMAKLTPAQARVAVEQKFPDSSVPKLIRDLTMAEQKMVTLKSDYSPEHPTYKAQQDLIDTIVKQLDVQVNGYIAGLKNQAAAASEKLKKLRELAGNQVTASPGQQSDSQAVTDEEEKEIRRIQAMIQNSPDLINAPGEGGTPLFRAALNGQLKVASYLLNHGADVNESAGARGVTNSWTPLYIAARQGHKAMVELLLKNGADINSKNGDGETPLYTAAKNGFQAVAEVLLAHKADVNVADNYKYTPLHVAVSNKRTAMVRLLLAKGACVNCVSSGGQTPIVSANAEITPLLLAAGANPNLSDERGRTPISYSANYAEKLQLLLKAKADPNVADKEGRTPLYYAVVNAGIDTVPLLLEAKADPNGGSLDQPLLALIENSPQRKVEICEMLLRAGADPNQEGTVRLRADLEIQRGRAYAQNNFKVNAIQLAVARSDTQIAKLLLNYKANANGLSTRDVPLLYQAAMDDNVELATALINHGADVNARGFGNSTPLHVAASRNNREMADLLLANKADVNVINDEHRTPLDLAKQWQTGSTTTANNGTLILNSPPPSMPVRVLRYPGEPTEEVKPPKPKVFTNDLATMLRQHGAVEALPDSSAIRITRQGFINPIVIFRRNTNDWNQFTLLETIASFYGRNTVYTSPNSMASPSGVLPFPDFSRVIIHRPSQLPGGKENQISVNLLNRTNVLDCNKDVALQFGDVVEIPVREHSLSEQSGGLTAEDKRQLSTCLTRKVRLIVRSQSRELEISPQFDSRNPDMFWIDQALQTPQARALLLSSSDLEHAKVTRKNQADKNKTLVVNASDHAAWDQSFWLRDGDVIEVPEK